MDKKNTIIGSLLIVAAFACYFISARYAPTPTSPAAIRQAVASQAAPAGPAPFAAPQEETAFAAVAADHAGSTITRLRNEFIEVRFTNFGGAIRDVALRKYPADLGRPDPFIFNEQHKDPMLAFVGLPGLDRGTRFQLVAQSADGVTFRAVLPNGVEVIRRYTLSPDASGATDPYEIRYETTFRNQGDHATDPIRVLLALGTAPTSPVDRGLYLTTGYSTGSKQVFTRRAQLEPSGGILGMGVHGPVPDIEAAGPLKWSSVSNQFFASILTPDDAAAGMTSRRVKLLSLLPDTDNNAYGITGDAAFDIGSIAPRGQVALSGSLYVGPKEYHRLANQDVFKADQYKVMQYGGVFISFFSGLLITLMTWTHSFVPNWGMAIICTTLILKIVFLPLTMVSARSARRMQKIQPELTALREKFKDNPQKQQAATMELFKQHKVNPMGGCLPMLITLPFFIGFYSMLRSTAELRFASFLWIHDLSAPDTVGHVLGYPINLLPILFTATSFFQMQLMPQPTVDNSQAKMMKFMPLITLFIYYTFSCSLSLYSTTNGLFMIGQQLVMNRGQDVGDPADKAKAKGGKPMRNVTPGKRK